LHTYGLVWRVDLKGYPLVEYKFPLCGFEFCDKPGIISITVNVYDNTIEVTGCIAHYGQIKAYVEEIEKILHE